MADKKYFIDDNVVIPDYIKKMSREELDTEIARLEAEAAKEKERIMKEKARKIS